MKTFKLILTIFCFKAHKFIMTDKILFFLVKTRYLSTTRGSVHNASIPPNTMTNIQYFLSILPPVIKARCPETTKQNV